ncbi:MAG TPA: hypothetical protein VGD58_04505 [Herpetosiphonaceae bacterium]
MDKSKQLSDSISGLISIAIDILFAKTPQRAAVGFLLGAILLVCSKLFRPVLLQITWLDIAAAQDWYYFVIGLAVLYLPVMFRLMFSTGRLSEDAELALEMIKSAEKAGLSKRVIGEMYLELSQAVLKNTILKSDVNKEMNNTPQDSPSKV